MAPTGWTLNTVCHSSTIRILQTKRYAQGFVHFSEISVTCQENRYTKEVRFSIDQNAMQRFGLKVPNSQ